VLGVGTAIPIGIVGGVFHMINHAMYKSCLFLTAGSVEKQAGTTDLRKLGGLAGLMPVTCICFVVAAASISGFPLTNGFYSKEMVYDGALESGWWFYLAAVLGTVLTAASFLKLGHAVYFGKRDAAQAKVREAPATMLLPMGILAVACIIFGVFNFIPLNGLVLPALAKSIELKEIPVGILPASWWLAGGTVLAISLALINHLVGAKRSGSGVGALDHIHHAPVLAPIYERAERGWFDPYKWAMAVANVVGHVGNAVNLVIDFLCGSFTVAMTQLLSWFVRAANGGNYAMYVLWSLAGAAVLIWYLLH
jgi:NADH-quinone oxidoreductase subunit L